MSAFRELIPHTWLAGLNGVLLDELEARLQPFDLVSGEDLFLQGQRGDSMCLLTDGGLEVFIRDREGAQWLVDRIAPGGIVGEMALLTGQQRTATVRATEPSSLLCLHKKDFDALASRYPALLTILGEYAGPRMQKSQLVDVLGDLFGPLEMEALQELRQRLTWLSLRSGSQLSLRDEPPGSMYIVISGRVRVDAMAADGAVTPLAEATRGDTIGEFNLLSGENHALNLLAIRDSNVVRVSQDVIEGLLQQNPARVMRFIRRASARLEPTSQVVRDQTVVATTIALLPISLRAPLQESARALAEALQPFGSVLRLSSASFDRRYGKQGAAQTSSQDSINIPILHWLTEQEQLHQFVIYECDKEWTPWTRRCLRQADRIVLVAWASDDAGLSQLERSLTDEEFQGRLELALLYPADVSLPSGAASWLALRDLHAHHHLRRGRSGDYCRLARRLIGREIALVLSGGGSRGFAHAGVYKALREAGIPVDLIGGTSMGALVGGTLAQGDGYEGVLAHADKYGAPQTLYDFTIPAVSFLASRKLTRMLTGIFGEHRIEDLWHPFFCISANLSLAQPIIHRRGLVWEAVRGSLALPGIFAPYLYQEDIVVDGGVMNNFPIDRMRADAPTGFVIGVNVSPPRELGRDYNFESGISGLRAILSRLNPFGSRLKVPSIFSILTRSVEVRGIYQMALVADRADLIIRPSVAEFNYLDFRPARAIAEAGYRAAMEQMDQILAAYKQGGFQLESS